MRILECVNEFTQTTKHRCRELLEICAFLFDVFGHCLKQKGGISRGPKQLTWQLMSPKCTYARWKDKVWGGAEYYYSTILFVSNLCLFHLHKHAYHKTSTYIKIYVYMYICTRYSKLCVWLLTSYERFSWCFWINFFIKICSVAC